MPTDSINELAALVTQLLRDKEETRRLLSAFGRGEITSEQIVNELASRYQTDIGSALQGLAEYDEAAALRLGERLKNRLETTIAGIDGRQDRRGSPQKAVVAPSLPRQQGVGTLTDRDNNVLGREFIIVSMLCENGNLSVRSGELTGAARKYDPAVSEEAVTAQLTRLVTSGIVARPRKGHYNSTTQSRAHLQALSSEIEARGLPLPDVPKGTP